MKCTFFGHRYTPDGAEPVLKEKIKMLIEKKGVKFFYVGNQGGFDKMALRVLRDLKKTYPQIEIFVVLAYLTEAVESDVQTLYPQGLEAVPRRFAIIKRNEWMIDKSDYVITYVRGPGGAYRSRETAIKKKKSVIDI